MVANKITKTLPFKEYKNPLFCILNKGNKKELKKTLFRTGNGTSDIAKIRQRGDGVLINIDFDNITDDLVYETFGVDNNEAEALNDIYLELFELLGRDAMLKLFKHYRGDKIDCPMRLYRPEFIADLAKSSTDRRERAKIARAGGYSAKAIETMLSKRRKENGNEGE